jgi:adenosine/AMP kinase
MQLVTEKLVIPEGANLILGQSHFIKTVEDLYEIMVSTVPGVKFGLAFSESSGECLIRVEGNDPDLMAAATENATRLAAGHTFNILLRNAFPINVLNAVKMCRRSAAFFAPPPIRWRLFWPKRSKAGAFWGGGRLLPQGRGGGTGQELAARHSQAARV